MSKVIDYTKMRKNKKRGIDYCPKCGRKGKARYYRKTNGLSFFHKGVIEFGFNNITESCDVR